MNYIILAGESVYVGLPTLIFVAGYLYYLYSKTKSKRIILAMVLYGVFFLIAAFEPTASAYICAFGFPILIAHSDTKDYNTENKSDIKEELDEDNTKENKTE